MKGTYVFKFESHKSNQKLFENLCRAKDSSKQAAKLIKPIESIALNRSCVYARYVFVCSYKFH